MALNNYSIGDLITPVDERNNIGIRKFYGININKEFMPTNANTTGLDERKYKIVRKNRFVYSGMQTGRDECIRISLYTEEEPVIVSPAYTTFEITSAEVVDPEYFFMIFMSKEMDRYGAFCSDGSVRSNLDWDVFCNIHLKLPNIENQRKYVAIYHAMQENQRSYEKGLDDLKLACEAYVEELRKNSRLKPLGDYITLSDAKNETMKYDVSSVRGISIEKKFIETKADMKNVSLKSYNLIPPNSFSYVTVTSRNGEKISLALNTSDETYICSGTYPVFYSTDIDILDPHYLNLILCRDEFNRYARFHSWGSARETFDWDELCKVQIPVPDIKIQRAISSLFDVYNKRREINERLKANLKNICPILIRGAVTEAMANS